MKRIEYRDVVDKSQWPRGPWDDEPDKIQFFAGGFPALIVRGPHGGLCGYVGVPKGHPWHGKQYASCRWDNPKAKDKYDEWPEVHGGLTFSAGCQHGSDVDKGICHIPAPGESDNVWWLGFDCAHLNDLTPAYAGLLADLPRLSSFTDLHGKDVYRDVAYVTKEIKNLAKQAKLAKAN